MIPMECSALGVAVDDGAENTPDRKNEPIRCVLGRGTNAYMENDQEHPCYNHAILRWFLVIMGGYAVAYKCCDERDFYNIWLD